MQEDDLTGDYNDFQTRRASFVMTFARVSKSVHREVMVLFWRCIYLESAEELAAVHAMMREPRSESDINLGTLCLHMELRIKGGYEPGMLADLIEHMPNVEVFIPRNVNESNAPVMHMWPVAITEALARHTPNLRRVQFESVGKEVDISQVKALLQSLRQLVTLHLDQESTKRYPDNILPTTASAQSLRVLSVGSVKREETWFGGADRTSHLLRCFPSAEILPSLTPVFLQHNSYGLRPFFEEFERQLYHVGLSATSPQGYGDRLNGGTLSRVQEVTIWAPEGARWAPIREPTIPRGACRVTIAYIVQSGRTSGGPGEVVVDVLERLKWCMSSQGIITVLAQKEQTRAWDWKPIHALQEALGGRGIAVNLHTW